MHYYYFGDYLARYYESRNSSSVKTRALLGNYAWLLIELRLRSSNLLCLSVQLKRKQINLQGVHERFISFNMLPYCYLLASTTEPNMSLQSRFWSFVIMCWMFIVVDLFLLWWSFNNGYSLWKSFAVCGHIDRKT